MSKRKRGHGRAARAAEAPVPSSSREPLLDRSRKHGVDPHDVPMGRYFDIASGIRGSDEGHKAAVGYYNRIAPMLRSPEGALKVAEEGLSIAEETRKRLAGMLGCKPMNVFFGNSATRTLIPVFLALSRRQKYDIVTQGPGYASLDALFEGDAERLQSSITMQNFGGLCAPRLLRTFDDIGMIRRLNREIGFRLFCEANHGDSDRLMASSLPRLYCAAYYDRMTGASRAKIDVFRSTTDYFRILKEKLAGNPDSLVIADASHAAGVMNLRATDLGDIVIFGSSKALGAEPTTGVCYVNDRVLSIMERELPQTAWPKVAFQFSPDTELGAGSAREAAETKFWTSLPELYSLGHVLAETDPSERASKIGHVRDYFLTMFSFFEQKGYLRVLTELAYDSNVPYFLCFEFPGNTGKVTLEKLGMISRLIPSGYKIHCESPFEHTSILAHQDSERAHGILDFGATFRVSWSHEHCTGDAIGFFREFGSGLDRIFGQDTSEGSRIIEFLFDGSACGKETRLQDVNDKEALKAISAFHPEERVRKAAFGRLRAVSPSSSDLVYVALNSKDAGLAKEVLISVQENRGALLKMLRECKALSAEDVQPFLGVTQVLSGDADAYLELGDFKGNPEVAVLLNIHMNVTESRYFCYFWRCCSGDLQKPRGFDFIGADDFGKTVVKDLGRFRILTMLFGETFRMDRIVKSALKPGALKAVLAARMLSGDKYASFFVAMLSENAEARSIGVKNLKGHDKELACLAKSCPHEDLKLAAVDLLEDPDCLVSVIEYGRSGDRAKERAAGRLGSMLGSIALNEKALFHVAELCAESEARNGAIFQLRENSRRFFIEFMNSFEEHSERGQRERFFATWQPAWFSVPRSIDRIVQLRESSRYADTREEAGKCVEEFNRTVLFHFAMRQEAYNLQQDVFGLRKRK